MLGKVDLVCAAPIVICAARPNSEAQRHRLQCSRLIAGDFEPFHLRREIERSTTDFFGGSSAAFGEQLTNSLAAPDQVNCPEQSITIAKLEPPLIEQAALDTFHGEGNRAAGADCIQAQIVTAARSPQHDTRIVDPTQRTKSEQIFVLDANTLSVVL